MCKTDLIPSLVSKFESKLGQDVHENAAQALVDIVAISVTSASSPLIAQLESEAMVKTLFGYILADVSEKTKFNLFIYFFIGPQL